MILTDQSTSMLWNNLTQVHKHAEDRSKQMITWTSL